MKEGKVVVGAKNIYKRLMEVWESTNNFAIKDDYSYWSEKDFSPNSGKFILINETDRGLHQIFFDDNIHSDPEFSIVDIRNFNTGESIPYNDAINTYMVQVDTIRAILDDEYFIKKINECEKNRAEQFVELKELERLYPSIKPMMPLIYEGLKKISRECTKNPVKSLARFLLNNQETDS